ncbi:hypothetical protein [Burkholderia sp. L27(2015)]|uniref:hypothetical protein n=1 Tax=Burkholderia sp. L27(2015) TaxID=1641858 RepID=UPI00131BEA80|nr:hypothetical protein [Burkholderia sp. L27(2015)]
MIPSTRRHRVHRGWALGLAVAATSTALSMSVLAGWQRGGWVAERVVWVAIGVVLVTSAHLIPTLSRSASLSVRCVAGTLWAACLIAACYGHATFFLRSQRHAGERRAEAVTLPVTQAVSSPGRSLTVIAAERAHVVTALAVANARRCQTDCIALHLTRVRLSAQLDALTAEAGEVTRQEADADRRSAQMDQALSSREALRDDPVTARLAALLGVTAPRVDLLSGLLFAGVLEGVACLFWFVAFQERDASVVEAVTLSTPESATSGNDGVMANPTSSQPVTRHDRQHDAQREITRLAQDIAAGQVRATVADIRRHLHCSQARAATLRRQLGELSTSP